MKTKMIMLMLSVVVVFGSFNIAPTKAEASNNPFTDIKGHWAEADIVQGYKDGLINGFEDGTFRPNDIVTGDQFLAMMYRSFSDGGGKFKSDFINQVKDYSLYSYHNLLNAVGEIGFDFQNASKGYWAKPFVDLAVKSELTTISQNHFDYENPNAYKKQIKREDAAFLISEWLKHYEYDYQLLYRIYLADNSVLVKDMNMFSYQSNSHGLLDSMLAGIMKGYPDGKFNPQRYITRAEAITVIQRLKYAEKRSPELPKPINKYYAESIDKKGVFMMQDKLSRDMFLSMRELFTNAKDGFVVENFGMIMWFENKARRDDFVYTLSIGHGFQSGKYPDFSLSTTNDNKIAFSIRLMTDLSIKDNSNLLDEALKKFSGKQDVSKLRNVLDDYLDNPKNDKFKLDNISYEVINSFDRIDIYRIY